MYILLYHFTSRRKLISNGIANPKFYGDVVYRARKFTYNPGKIFFIKGYLFNIVIKSLNIVVNGFELAVSNYKNS